MSDVSQYLQSASFGLAVRSITGDNHDGLTAGGFSAWVQSVTGEVPTVRNLGNGRARVLLTQSQVEKMQTWLDSIMAKPLDPPRVEYDMGPVFAPWAIKKALPVVGAILAAGFLAGWLTWR